MHNKVSSCCDAREVREVREERVAGCLLSTFSHQTSHMGRGRGSQGTIGDSGEERGVEWEC